MNNNEIRKSVKSLIDNSINLFNDKEQATELINKYGMYLTFKQVETYIKKINNMK